MRGAFLSQAFHPYVFLKLYFTLFFVVFMKQKRLGATSDVGDDVFANLVEDPDELPFDENSDDDDEIEPGDGHLVVDEGGDSSLPKAEVC